jgi:hypothetical protein
LNIDRNTDIAGTSHKVEDIYGTGTTMNILLYMLALHEDSTDDEKVEIRFNLIISTAK